MADFLEGAVSANSEYADWEAFKRAAISGGGTPVVGTEFHEVLAAGDGVNRVFELGHLPVIADNVRVFLNGMRLVVGDDYTVSGQQVTMESAPDSGAKLLAEYRY